MFDRVAPIIGIIVLAGLLASFSIENTSVESKPPIKIAINEWPGYAHAFIAVENGYFEKNGVEVELIFDRDYSTSQQRYLNGEVDGVFEVLADTMFRNAEGIPSKIVYVMDYSESGDVIVGSVNSIDDLKGKTIGVEGINSFSHIFALKTIESYGLTEGDVFFDIILAQDVVTELDKDTIQAGHTWEPTRSVAIEKGYKILATAGDYPYLVTDVLSFNSEIIDERPDDIQNIIKSMLDAQNFQKHNLDEAVTITAKPENVSESSMLAGINSVFMTDINENYRVMHPSIDPSLEYAIEDLGKLYLQRGQISYVPSFDDIIEPKFVVELYE